MRQSVEPDIAVARRESVRARLAALRRGLGTTGIIGVMIVAAYGVLALAAPFLGLRNPTAVQGSAKLQPPSFEFWFGTDANGMDVFSRVIYAARLDLPITFGAVAGSIVVGVALGLATGYIGGVFDSVVMRGMDILQAFPAIILGLAVVAATSQSLTILVIVIALLDTPIYVRMMRDNTLRLRDSTFVEAAKAVGASRSRVLLRHILPNTFPPLIVQTAIRLSWAIKVIAALAFVGVGIQVPTPEWGAMIRQGSAYMANGQWWISVFPGLAIVVLVLGFNLIADAMQDWSGRYGTGRG